MEQPMTPTFLPFILKNESAGQKICCSVLCIMAESTALPSSWYDMCTVCLVPDVKKHPQLHLTLCIYIIITVF